MATSRKRERELARRRFERRRQRELERRAAAKRRNTIVGSSLGTAAVIAVVVVLIVHFAGHHNHKASKVSAVPTPTVSTPAASTPAVSNEPAPKTCKKVSPNPPAKGQPIIPGVTGKDPTKLVVKDIKVGHGRSAKNGDNLSVTYIGVGCSTGTVFDATYRDGNKPFPVDNLGQASVITGWNQGLVGIKPGGVRELIIPGKLAYAGSPQAPTFPNDTLIFRIQALSVTK